MSDPGGSTLRLSRKLGSVVQRSSPHAAGKDRLQPRAGNARPAARAVGTTPTILIAGVVPHRERLDLLGQVERAGWGAVGRNVARADLVVIGQASAAVDVVAVIAGLKAPSVSGSAPVLHAPPIEAPCAACRADVCLSSGSASGQLARVAQVLLDLGRRRRGGRAGAGLEPRSQQVRSLGAHL